MSRCHLTGFVYKICSEIEKLVTGSVNNSELHDNIYSTGIVK
jgi:hypothetical protein